MLWGRGQNSLPKGVPVTAPLFETGSQEPSHSCLRGGTSLSESVWSPQRCSKGPAISYAAETAGLESQTRASGDVVGVFALPWDVYLPPLLRVHKSGEVW